MLVPGRGDHVHPDLLRQLRHDVALLKGAASPASPSSARATVKDVFVGDIDDGEATAVTVVDLTADGPGGRRAVADTYLVDGVTRLDFALVPAGGDTGGGG